MTERYRAADVRVDRATTHYGHVAEELAAALATVAPTVSHRAAGSVADSAARMGYVPRHAAVTP
jgi:hypothetical protein